MLVHEGERGAHSRVVSRRQFGRLRKLPSGRWQARYPVGDGRLRTAPRTFPTNGEASSYLSTVEADLARGQYMDPRSGRITFSRWVEQWLARPGKRANSVARDRQALETFMYDLGPRPMSSIVPMHIQAVIDARSKVAAPATVARDYSALRAVFNAAVDADVIGRSPARKLALPRVRPPARVSVATLQLERLAQEVPPRYRALVLVAGVLGLRWGEAVGLRVRDVDFLSRTITVAHVVEETSGHLALAFVTPSRKPDCEPCRRPPFWLRTWPGISPLTGPVLPTIRTLSCSSVPAAASSGGASASVRWRQPSLVLAWTSR